MLKDVVTLKSGSKVTQRHWKWCHSIDCVRFILLRFFSNFVHNTHCFWDIRLVSIPWPWNPGYGSLKVIENDTIQSRTHDFLLTFHSNHRPILHRFRGKRRFPSKITNFHTPPPPCTNSLRWRGYPWNLVSAQGQKKLEWWGYQLVEKF